MLLADAGVDIYILHPQHLQTLVITFGTITGPDLHVAKCPLWHS